MAVRHGKSIKDMSRDNAKNYQSFGYPYSKRLRTEITNYQILSQPNGTQRTTAGGMSMAEQWTQRMREIVRLMRDGAVIYEKRDAFMERSTYSLESTNQPGDPGYGKSAHKVQQAITEGMVLRLAPYLFEGRNPVYRNGKYVTAQSTYYYPDHPGIPREADGYEPGGEFEVTFPEKPLPKSLQRTTPPEAS